MSNPQAIHLEQLAEYLKSQNIQTEFDENAGQRFLRMGWRFEMGDAAIIVNVIDGPNQTLRIEIGCVTQKSYQERRAEALSVLNDRNRERAFSRSLDKEGNYWMQYVGFYHTSNQMPQETFEALFGSVLMHFQDDYAVLEGYIPAPQA